MTETPGQLIENKQGFFARLFRHRQKVDQDIPLQDSLTAKSGLEFEKERAAAYLEKIGVDETKIISSFPQVRIEMADIRGRYHRAIVGQGEYDEVNITLPDEPGRYGKEMRAGEILKFSYTKGLQQRAVGQGNAEDLTPREKAWIGISVFPPREGETTESYRIKINREKSFMVTDKGAEITPDTNEDVINTALAVIGFEGSIQGLTQDKLGAFISTSINRAIESGTDNPYF